MGVDSILGNSLRAFTANALLMIGLAAVLIGGPGLFIMLVANGTAQGTASTVAIITALTERTPLLLVGAVLAVIGTMLLQATYTYVVMRFLANKQVSFEEAIRVGLKRLGNVVVIAILTGVGIGLGMMLLLVPGLVLMAMWYVAVPVSIAEDCSATDSITRSATLTAGYRWPVFGLAVIVLVIGIGIGLLTELVTVAMPQSAVVVEIVTNILLSVFGAIVPAVTYHRLIIVKDGARIDDIASVFD